MSHETEHYTYRLRANNGSEVLVEHGPFVRSILSALATAFTQPGTSLPAMPPSPIGSQATRASRRVSELEDKLERAARKLERLGEKVDRLEGAAELRAARAYNEKDEQVAAIRTALTEARQRRDGAIASEAARRMDNTLDLLPYFVSQLRNPRASGSADFAASLIEDLEFTTRQDRVDGRARRITEWTGTLRLQQGGRVIMTPFAGSHARTSRRGFDPARGAQDVLRGVPLSRTVSPARRPAFMSEHPRAALKALTGLTDANEWILTVTDPDLLRLHVANAGISEQLGSLSAESRSRETMTNFGSVEVLEQRIQQVALHLSTIDSPTWLRRTNRVEDRWLIRAALGETPGRWNPKSSDWRIEDRVAHLVPCSTCESQAMCRLLLREATGLVCLHCRRDRAGVIWPAATYDRYLSSPQLWTEQVPELVPRTSVEQDDYVRTPRANEIPRARRKEIIDDYHRMSVKAVLAKHNLKLARLYEILELEGAPRKQTQRRARRARSEEPG